MISYDDHVFFESCRAIGGSFYSETHKDPKFATHYFANRSEWDGITQGLLLVLFCHLIETTHGDKGTFKSKLKTAANADIVDALFIARNTFVHCKWDISKLDFQKQITRIRKFIGAGYNHPSLEFGMSLSGNKLQISGLEVMCRVLFADI